MQSNPVSALFLKRGSLCQNPFLYCTFKLWRWNGATKASAVPVQAEIDFVILLKNMKYICVLQQSAF